MALQFMRNKDLPTGSHTAKKMELPEIPICAASCITDVKHGGLPGLALVSPHLLPSTRTQHQGIVRRHSVLDSCSSSLFFPREGISPSLLTKRGCCVLIEVQSSSLFCGGVWHGLVVSIVLRVIGIWRCDLGAVNLLVRRRNEASNKNESRNVLCLMLPAARRTHQQVQHVQD